MNKYLLTSVCCLLGLLVNGQTKGYFTSEAETCIIGNKIVVGIKQYNPSKEDIEQATKRNKKGLLTYLQVPHASSNVSMEGNLFESKLFLFDSIGKPVWNISLGYSNVSTAPPVTTDGNFVYSGASLQKEDKVTIGKYDQLGKQVWKCTIDSMEQIASIQFMENKLVALVYFESSQKIQDKKESFSIRNFPVYHFVSIDPETGKLLSKEYQQMGNYLSSIGFGGARLNSYRSYYVSNKDSLIFLSKENQKSASVVSDKKPSDEIIVVWGAGLNSNFFITKKERKFGDLLSAYYDDYDKKVTFSAMLDESEMNGMFTRYFVKEPVADSLIAVVTNNQNITVATIGSKGKGKETKKVNRMNSIICGLNFFGKELCLVTTKGREVVGQEGDLAIHFISMLE